MSLPTPARTPPGPGPLRPAASSPAARAGAHPSPAPTPAPAKQPALGLIGLTQPEMFRKERAKREKKPAGEGKAKKARKGKDAEAGCGTKANGDSGKAPIGANEGDVVEVEVVGGKLVPVFAPPAPAKKPKRADLAPKKKPEPNLFVAVEAHGGQERAIGCFKDEGAAVLASGGPERGGSVRKLSVPGLGTTVVLGIAWNEAMRAVRFAAGTKQALAEAAAREWKMSPRRIVWLDGDARIDHPSSPGRAGVDLEEHEVRG